MTSLEDVMIRPPSSVRQALETINASRNKVVLVIDEERRLLGTVTDGDIRRGILAGVGLPDPVTRVMNKMPIVARSDQGDMAILALMKRMQVVHIPVLDDAGRVVRLVTEAGLVSSIRDETWIVLMAGGLGTRLRPLTNTTPKPLLPVGGRPLLEIIIENFQRQGYERFILSVNYMAEQLIQHFGDGSRLKVDIEYLMESERLGTAGALRLLPRRPPGPILVMNADILTTLDARLLMAFHREQRSPATICVQEYSWRVPYGVVRVDPEGRLEGFEEKPLRRELISAGINVISPEVLDLIPAAGAFDMPNLLRLAADRIAAPAIYPLREYWLDIGQMEDLRRAQQDVVDLFGEPLGPTPPTRG